MAIYHGVLFIQRVEQPTWMVPTILGRLQRLSTVVLCGHKALDCGIVLSGLALHTVYKGVVATHMPCVVCCSNFMSTKTQIWMTLAH